MTAQTPQPDQLSDLKLSWLHTIREIDQSAPDTRSALIMKAGILISRIDQLTPKPKRRRRKKADQNQPV